jgi:hypothetical protein
MHGARNGQIATRLLNGTVLVAGGFDNTELASAELYDPISRIWTATGDMLSVDRRTATLLLNGRVLVTGGSFNPSVPDLFDPGSGT